MDQLTEKKNLYLRANDMYHRGGESPLLDSEFDALRREIAASDPNWFGLKLTGAQPAADSPLTKLQHQVHMGSIANALNEEEFNAWHAKTGSLPLVATIKVDGVSLMATYNAGVLCSLVTRGDGMTGENVLHHAAFLKQLPLVIDYPELCFVRGEVVMQTNDWNVYRQQNPDAKNARNVTAGIIGRKESKGGQFLSFFAHHLWTFDPTISPMFDSRMIFLRDLGFTTPPSSTIAAGQASAVYGSVANGRSSLPFEADGVVFIVNDQNAWFNMGIDGENCPRGSVAWKFPAQSAQSKLIAVEHEVGSTGQITPVGVVEPVLIGGVTVTRASLYNYEEVARLDVGIGEVVEVSRQGDTIPKILRRTGQTAFPRVMIEEPKVCPVCGGTTARKQVGKKKTDGAVTFCMNDDCSAKPAGRIARWCKSLDIKELGDEVIDGLMKTTYRQIWIEGSVPPLPLNADDPIVRNPSDLYMLTDVGSERLGNATINGKRLGVNRAKKIIANIEAKRNLTVDEVLGSIGVPDLGKGRVKLIREAARKAYGPNDGKFLDTIDYWFSPGRGDSTRQRSTLITYAAPLGIPNMAEALQAGIDKARPLIEELLAAGVVIVPPKEVTVTDGKLSGQSFAFTGCRPTPAEKDRLAALGGAEKSGVSEGLTHLVMKTVDLTSAKAKKAQSLGINMVSYEHFQEMIA